MSAWFAKVIECCPSSEALAKRLIVGKESINRITGIRHSYGKVGMEILLANAS